MNRELAYRCQMLTPKTLKSLSETETALLKAGWSKEVLKADLHSAMAWARSQINASRQAKAYKTRAFKQSLPSAEEDLQAVFATAGVDPRSIPVRRG